MISYSGSFGPSTVEEIQEKDDLDFALSLDCFTKQGEEQVEKEKYKVFKPEEAVALLLSPRVIVGCWNKI